MSPAPGRYGPYGMRQRWAGRRKGAVRSGRIGLDGGFPVSVRSSYGFPHLFQELAMADVAFVVTTIAVFALMAFIAKGVAKL